MAYNNKEKELIVRFREKMGDTPTRQVVDSDVNKTVYKDEAPVLVAIADVGKICADIEKQIWTDSEYYTQLKSSLALVSKGKLNNLVQLNTFEEEIVLIQGQVIFNYMLAQNAARYIKYKNQSVESERVSPGQFINIAKALETSLRTLLDEGSDSKELGATVRQAVIRRQDAYTQSMEPMNYQPPNAPLDFFLTNGVGKIYIFIPYQFLADYRAHYIQKVSSKGTNIIFNSYILDERTIEDTDVVDGEVYQYTLFVEGLNAYMQNTTKRSIMKSITYAAQQ